MPFEPQNALERSLMKAATDPANCPQFYRDLLESDLFILPVDPPSSVKGQVELHEDMELKLRQIQIEGKSYIPIFSALVRLQQVLQGDANYIAMKARDFLTITQGADLFLNPGSEYGKAFLAAEVARMLDGSLWKPDESFVIKHSAKILLGEPKRYPQALVDALSRCFAGEKSVRKAYVALMYQGGDERPHTLIGLDVEGEWKRISARAGIVIRNVDVPDPPIDIIQLTGGANSIESYFRQAKPFYRRKVLGLF